MKRCSAALLLILAAGTAMAAPIYRCGQTYSQTPCANGRLIDSADPRTAAQRAEARRVAAKERRLAAEMERERLVREAAPRPAAAGFDSRAASAPADSAPRSAKGKRNGGKTKPAPTTDFVAVDPRSKAAASSR